MAIPNSCTVLVVGGGPGGAYAAAALAREGINTVCLEADIFPRYHIGESMLASMRHFLRFIDLEGKFEAYGFRKKVGAAFKMTGTRQEGFTDFIAAGGPNNYAWNVIRSESDDLIFRHAGECGAKCFDGVKVDSLNFQAPATPDAPFPLDTNIKDPGRPVSANYTRKATGEKATVQFDYLVDASGRAGVYNTKYLKNRKYNKGLKNVANWAYWRGGGVYAPGTNRAGAPYFEALTDESGWCWFIPLHDGTHSVGVVMNQDVATSKKKEYGSVDEFYSKSLGLAPNVTELLSSAERQTEVKSASDFSYDSTSYAAPHVRIVGDAGCFIDPYFSSGVHLALAGALSAAMTIAASLRGDVDELFAANWHSNKVTDGYERFRLVVLSAYRQIRRQNEAILSDFGEDNLDKAFALFRPVIQGTADTSNKITQDELTKTIDFCAAAFNSTRPEDQKAVLEKLQSDKETMELLKGQGEITKEKLELFNKHLTEEEQQVVKHIRARNMMRTEDTMNISNFTSDIINGYAPQLKQGSLGLVKAAA